MTIESTSSRDRALGMDATITRRDFLNAGLLAAGGALLGGATPIDLLAARPDEWNGYSGIGDYAGANGNTFEVVAEGHRIRDGAYAHTSPARAADGGTFDCVVVGGGISGLAAALFFQRRAGAGRRCLVLEDHAIFGGQARQNEFEVDGHRLVGNQASALFFPPRPGTFLADFYPSIGIEQDAFEYQDWAGSHAPMALGRSFYFSGSRTSAFYFGPQFGQPAGMLLIDPWGTRLEGAPIPDSARQDLLRMQDTRGVRARSLPKEHGDPASRQLDAITLEQHVMEQYSIGRETLRTFLSPVTGGGSGLGADALSAYADYAADVLLPWQYDKGAQMFPGGNAGVARHLVKAMIPDAIPGANRLGDVCRGPLRRQALDRRNQRTRIRTGCTVFAVEHEGQPDSAHRVRVLYSRNGKIYRATARSAIVAGGSWTSKHIVGDLPASHREAYAQFHRAPCLIANLAVRNWRFLYDQGIHECRWFEGIGNYTAVRRIATFGPVSPTISPDSPVVLTLKILFARPGLPVREQVALGRAELLETPYRGYERRIREHLAAMFGRGGFDPRRHIAGLILNRWGHAYLSPQPGFFFGSGGRPGPGEILRTQPVGRIAFANSDLTGIMDHRTSILEADRAVTQVLERLD